MVPGIMPIDGSKCGRQSRFAGSQVRTCGIHLYSTCRSSPSTLWQYLYSLLYLCREGEGLGWPETHGCTVMLVSHK